MRKKLPAGIFYDFIDNFIRVSVGPVSGPLEKHHLAHSSPIVETEGASLSDE